MIERVARGLVVALLERIESGQLTLVEGGSRRVFGSGSPQATVVVHDPASGRAARAAARGWPSPTSTGWWDSPDVTAVIEVAARNLHGIDRVRRAMTPVREPWQRGRAFLERNTPLRAREDIAAHYDLGNDLFELMLDETMMYSSAIFERRDMTLAEASRAKLDRICDKLDLGPADHVLEIGTGWGGFALHAALDARLPRDDDDAVARAARVGAGARPRGRAGGPRDGAARRLPRARPGSYDKLVSIEMIEAVGWKDFGTFFERCAALLRPGRRDGAAGDHDRRPPVRGREGPALVHELADLPERLPAVGRGDRAQRRPPQ